MPRLPLKLGRSLVPETPIPNLPNGHVQEDADMKMTRRLTNVALLILAGMADTD